MNGFLLRVIAMSTMLIDHIGWNFLDTPMLLTWIGRIAFPLYAFLLAEGFLIICRDRERLSKHLAIIFPVLILPLPVGNLSLTGENQNVSALKPAEMPVFLWVPKLTICGQMRLFPEKFSARIESYRRKVSE